MVERNLGWNCAANLGRDRGRALDMLLRDNIFDVNDIVRIEDGALFLSRNFGAREPRLGATTISDTPTFNSQSMIESFTKFQWQPQVQITKQRSV